MRGTARARGRHGSDGAARAGVRGRPARLRAGRVERRRLGGRRQPHREPSRGGGAGERPGAVARLQLDRRHDGRHALLGGERLDASRTSTSTRSARASSGSHGLAVPETGRIDLSPDVCVPVRRFLLEDYAPRLSFETFEPSQALVVLAHEAERPAYAGRRARTRSSATRCSGCEGSSAMRGKRRATYADELAGLGVGHRLPAEVRRVPHGALLRRRPVRSAPAIEPLACLCGAPGLGDRQRRGVGGGRGGGRPAARRARLHGRDRRARRGDGGRAPRARSRRAGRRSRSSPARAASGRTSGPTTSSSPESAARGISRSRRRETPSSPSAGKWGTLAEIAFARMLGRRVVALEGAPEVEGVERAATPAEAVELALRDLE